MYFSDSGNNIMPDTEVGLMDKRFGFRYGFIET